MALPTSDLLPHRVALADVAPAEQTGNPVNAPVSSRRPRHPRSPQAHSVGNPEIDSYIRSLNYDPRQLLSMWENGSTESLPAGKAKTRDTSSNKVVICTKEKHDLDKKLTDVAILRPTNGVIFPGALVRANRRLAEGTPDPIALSRSPLTISVDLPGLGKDGIQTVQDAKNSNVQTAINKILETWNTNPSSQGYVNAARSSLNVQKAYSSEQLALNLGFSLEGRGLVLRGHFTLRTLLRRLA